MFSIHNIEDRTAQTCHATDLPIVTLDFWREMSGLADLWVRPEEEAASLHQWSCTHFHYWFHSYRCFYLRFSRRSCCLPPSSDSEPVSTRWSFSQTAMGTFEQCYSLTGQPRRSAERQIWGLCSRTVFSSRQSHPWSWPAFASGGWRVWW